MIFDAHTHINNESYSDSEREALIKDIEASSVSYVMDIGFDLESSKKAIHDANHVPWCYAAVGVHPHDTDNMTMDTLNSLRELSKYEKVKAIGEIGLDYHYDNSDRDNQRKWFVEQLKLAKELNLPVVIHSRDADQETFDILDREMLSVGLGKKVYIHCFSGSAELAKEYVKKGAMIGICGPVTYKNNKKTIKVAEEIPLENILVETDAPYLTPEPLRGRENKSPYIEHTVRKLAEIKNLPFEEVANTTCLNAKRLYDIK